MALPASHNWSGDGNAANLGANWTDVVQGFKINSGTAVADATTFNMSFWNADVFAAGHYSETVRSNAASGYYGCAVACKSASGGSCYAAFFNSTSTLYKLHAGTWTDTSQAIGNCANGDTLHIETDGAGSPTITVKKNGVTVLTWQDTGSVGGAALSGGSAGLATYGQGESTNYVSWTGGNTGGGGGSASLFRQAALVGLGAGGPFFSNPLSAPMRMHHRARLYVPERFAA